MGQSSKSRAKGASAAGAPEVPQPPIPLVRPRERGSATAPAVEKPSRFAGLDVAGHLTLLREAFEKRSHPGSETHADPRLAWLFRLAQQVAAQRRRLLKALVGLLIVAAVGWMPVRTLLQTTSTEAIVNARLITLRAPIEGEIAPGLDAFRVGTELPPGTRLLRIVNQRAERGRLDDLRRLANRLEGERAAFMARRDDVERLHADLAAQTRAFMDGRLRQLEARMAELRSEIAAATANREEAERALARARPLAASNTMSSAAFEKVRRDATVATETQGAMRHRLAGVEVEVAALRQGVFIGDSYNDRPRSSQRADELAQRLGEVVADIRERETQLASLRTEIAEEGQRHEALAAAELSAPVRGSVWEVMTAPGETVVRGQELVRVLDCSGVVVTATVGETAYNRLRIGDPARFRLRGEGSEHKGRIIGLTGVAAAPANLAIQPSALAKEPYRVTVALPGLATPGQCDVGRTGRVTFDK